MEGEKRKREDDDITNQSKKQEYCINKPHGYEDRGVFDFPWLKEGLVFKGDDDYLDGHDYKFSYLREEAPENFDEAAASSLNLCVSPTSDANFYHDTKFDDDGFWSLLVDHSEPVDDPEPVDVIWNCVIDQPLDMGFYKGL